jgi:hypothetical protein
VHGVRGSKKHSECVCACVCVCVCVCKIGLLIKKITAKKSTPLVSFLSTHSPPSVWNVGSQLEIGRMPGRHKSRVRELAHSLNESGKSYVVAAGIEPRRVFF